ncbi:MAG: hypothetical protein KL863_21965 [Rhizobium sp.]|nr:hypothetical protein [Rhizobium sp.]
MTTFEELRATFAITPEERTLLLHSTAEALALPQMVCGRRICRRGHRCTYVAVDESLPACLSDLSVEQHAAFDALFALVARIAEGWDRARPSSDPTRRTEEILAIRIVQCSLPSLSRSARQAAEWVHYYFHPPPPTPPVDIAAFRAEVAAELARAGYPENTAQKPRPKDRPGRPSLGTPCPSR